MADDSPPIPRKRITTVSFKAPVRPTTDPPPGDATDRTPLLSQGASSTINNAEDSLRPITEGLRPRSANLGSLSRRRMSTGGSRFRGSRARLSSAVLRIRDAHEHEKRASNVLKGQEQGFLFQTPKLLKDWGHKEEHRWAPPILSGSDTAKRSL